MRMRLCFFEKVVSSSIPPPPKKKKKKESFRISPSSWWREEEMGEAGLSDSLVLPSEKKGDFKKASGLMQR